MTIAAEVQRIRDVFSPGADIRVPPFQRAYAWEDEETEVLIRDLLEAFRAGTVYFLGAIVVIRPRNKGPLDVVDGQQRLTTLTILLAVLRDLALSREQESQLHNMIGHETMGMVFGGGHHWRMTLNRSDTPFFRRYVQERGATKNQDAMVESAAIEGSPSQTRLAAAVAQLHEFMTDMGDEERTRFAAWLLDEVSIVRVRVSEYAVAYKVFQALNHRGKPLSDHDILKSALFERVGFTAQEAQQQSDRWNTYTSRLGDRGFADMWKQIRSLYDREGAGEMVSAVIAGITPRSSIGEFLNNKLPRFVDAYDVIVNGRMNGLPLSEEAQRRICYLRSIHHESWRAPAIRFLVEQAYDPDEADRFFWALERLAYTMQYSVRDREYRHKRYRKVLDAMERGALFDADSPLDLSRDEKADLVTRLRGRFPNFKQRRALLMRLSGAVEGARALPPETDCTVEHILPRTFPKGSDWVEDWSRQRDRDDLTECIGNFTLLTHDENQVADRKSFRDKLDIYFKDGKASFALSHDLKGRTRWTPEDVKTRRDALIQNLAKDWDL
jgi:hypothetical protein